MRALGYLLLVGGFVAASYVTALDTHTVRWALFLPAGFAALVGVALIKRHAHGFARAAGRLNADRRELGESIGNIVAVLDELERREAAIGGPELREQIDERLRDDLRRFADARESMIHLFGLQAYADIMSEFAAGERYINRVWSASADGYDGEARTYLARATEQFRDTRRRLESAGGS